MKIPNANPRPSKTRTVCIKYLKSDIGLAFLMFCRKKCMKKSTTTWACISQLSEMLGMGYTASGYLSCDGFDAFLWLYLFLSLLLFWQFCPLCIARPTYRRLWETLFLTTAQANVTSILFAPIYSLHYLKTTTTQPSKMSVSCNSCRFRVERNNELLLYYRYSSQCYVCISLSTNLIRFNTH